MACDDKDRPQLAWKTTRHEFATRRTTRVALLARTPGSYIRALALSPDERALLYVQIDGSASDLMLLENFR